MLFEKFVVWWSATTALVAHLEGCTLGASTAGGCGVTSADVNLVQGTIILAIVIGAVGDGTLDGGIDMVGFIHTNYLLNFGIVVVCVNLVDLFRFIVSFFFCFVRTHDIGQYLWNKTAGEFAFSATLDVEEANHGENSGADEVHE